MVGNEEDGPVWPAMKRTGCTRKRMGQDGR